LTNAQVLNDEESKGDEEHELGLVLQQAFPTHSLEILKNPYIWVGDTGATTNTCHSKEGCVNEQENNALSMGIEGKASKCHSEVDIPGTICNKYGNEVQDVTLKKRRYNPKANFNLLSSTKSLMDGWIMTGDQNAIVMKKGNNEIRFDIGIKTKTGAIFAAYIKQRNAPELQGGMIVKEGSQMCIEKAHDLLGHSHEDATRATAKCLGWELSKGVRTCQSCAESKAKQKIVTKKTEGKKAKKPN